MRQRQLLEAGSLVHAFHHARKLLPCSIRPSCVLFPDILLKRHRLRRRGGPGLPVHLAESCMARGLTRRPNTTQEKCHEDSHFHADHHVDSRARRAARKRLRPQDVLGAAGPIALLRPTFHSWVGRKARSPRRARTRLPTLRLCSQQARSPRKRDRRWSGAGAKAGNRGKAAWITSRVGARFDVNTFCKKETPC